MDRSLGEKRRRRAIAYKKIEVNLSITALSGNALLPNSEVYALLLSAGRVFQYPAFLNQLSANWTAYAVYGDEQLLAVLPLVLSKRAGIEGSFIPQHAHVYGPVFSSQAMASKGAIVALMLQEIKQYALVEWKLPIEDQDVLPYLSSGCLVQATQSHLIPQGTPASMELVHPSKRRYLKKLIQKKDKQEIVIKWGEACYDDLVQLQRKTAEKSGFQTNLTLLEKMIKGLGDQHAYSLVLYSDQGEALSGAFCPFDAHYAYHIINASVHHEDALLNKSNILAAYLAVNEALNRGLGFDFEGSNIPGVAQFYRMMGGQPSLFYRVQKANNWKGKLLFSSLYWK